MARITDNAVAFALIILIGSIFLTIMIISYFEDAYKHEQIQECIKSGKSPRECLCAFDPNRSICQ